MTEIHSWAAALGITEVEKLHWQLTDSLTPVSKIGYQCSLAAAVELTLIGSSIGNRAPRTKMIRVSDCPLWKLFSELNWLHRERPTRMRDGETLALCASKNHFGWWNDSLRQLERELEEGGFQRTTSRALAGAVGEMLDNVWLHSQESQALLAYQIRRRRFAFSVADSGIGILKSLAKNTKYKKLSSSAEAIKEALKPGVSSHEDGTGLGFSDLLHSLAELWGIVRVRSGEASVVIDRRTEERKKQLRFVPSLPGVHISVSCSLDPARANRKSLD
jgi:anti-sigma regulatory factor (Ser/Thr protein kinase)